MFLCLINDFFKSWIIIIYHATFAYDTNIHLPTILMFCGHSFFSKCVNEIKKKNNLCPACRGNDC